MRSFRTVFSPLVEMPRAKEHRTPLIKALMWGCILGQNLFSRHLVLLKIKLKSPKTRPKRGISCQLFLIF
jgi:hypothetical protein